MYEGFLGGFSYRRIFPTFFSYMGGIFEFIRNSSCLNDSMDLFIDDLILTWWSGQL